MADKAPENSKEFNHYFKKCGYEYIDVYRVIKLFGVTDPCMQHLIKKALCLGNRGQKDAIKDAKEIIASAERYIEMIGEENAVNSHYIPPPVFIDPREEKLKKLPGTYYGYKILNEESGPFNRVKYTLQCGDSHIFFVQKGKTAKCPHCTSSTKSDMKFREEDDHK